MNETPMSSHLTGNAVSQLPAVAVIPNVPLPAHQNQILGRSNGLSFLNAELELSAKEGVLHLDSTGKKNNFMEMSQDRGNTDNLKMNDAIIDAEISLGRKLPLANVGVSVAVVIDIAGEDYLILARRPNGMLLLPSGYVDVANPGVFKNFAEHALETALKELGEEIIVRTRDSQTGEEATKTYQIEASTDNAIWATVGSTGTMEYSADSSRLKINLAPAYEGNGEDLYNLKYQTDNPLQLKPTNDLSFLPSLELDQQLLIDGQELQHGNFYYLRETKSGQLVYPFRLELKDLTGLSFQHAETGPAGNGKPGDLIEVLDPGGILLAKLSSTNGLLTGETFQLTDGSLIATGISSDKLILSEVFNTKFIGVDWDSALLAVTIPKEVDGKVIKTATILEYQQLALASLHGHFPEKE